MKRYVAVPIPGISRRFLVRLSYILFTGAVAMFLVAHSYGFPGYVAVPLLIALVVAGILCILIVRLSGTYTLGVDKITGRDANRRVTEFHFDQIHAILTTPGSMELGARTRLIVPLGLDPYLQSTKLPARQADIKRRVVRMLSEHASALDKEMEIGTSVERYPHLLADILERCRHALVDPFTRIAASYAIFASDCEDTSRRPHYMQTAFGRDDPQVRRHLGRFSLAAAERRLRESAKADPENAELHALLGEVLLLRANMADAADEFEAAVSRNPGYPNARFHLGLARFYTANFGEARDQFRKVLEARPGDPVVLGYLGCANCRTGDWADAESAFRSVEKQPSIVMQRSASKCLQCLADCRESGDPKSFQRPPKQPFVLQALAALAGVLGVLVEHVISDSKHSKGLLGGLFGVVVYLVFAFGKAYLHKDNAHVPSSTPCWLQLGWMKSDYIEQAGSWGNRDRHEGGTASGVQRK